VATEVVHAVVVVLAIIAPTITTETETMTMKKTQDRSSLKLKALFRKECQMMNGLMLSKKLREEAGEISRLRQNKMNPRLNLSPVQRKKDKTIFQFK